MQIAFVKPVHFHPSDIETLSMNWEAFLPLSKHPWFFLFRKHIRLNHTQLSRETKIAKNLQYKKYQLTLQSTIYCAASLTLNHIHYLGSLHYILKNPWFFLFRKLICLNHAQLSGKKQKTYLQEAPVFSVACTPIEN